LLASRVSRANKVGKCSFVQIFKIQSTRFE